MRRAIFVEVSGSGEWTPDFEEKLLAEGGAFIWHCITKYLEYCPSHGPIPVNHKDSGIAEWVSTLEEPYETAFEEWFEPAPGELMTPITMLTALRLLFPHRGQQLKFCNWMARVHGIKKKCFRKDGSEPRRFYTNVKLRRPLTSVTAFNSAGYDG